MAKANLKPGGNKKFKCEQCGAENTKNGKPFTHRTLQVHIARSHQNSVVKSPFGLTLRQRELIELLIQGITEQEIARRIGLSYHTVHTHVRNIYARLGVANRVGAVTIWMRHKQPKIRSDQWGSKLKHCPECGCNLADFRA